MTVFTDVVEASFLFVLLLTLTPVIVIAVLIGLIFSRRRTVPPPPTESSALAILAERFARGEISREEFEERRAVLARER